MRPKLLIERKDPDVQIYLKELGVPLLKLQEGESNNLVVIAVQDDNQGKYLNSFHFTKEAEAIDFFEAINRALGFQLYCQKLTFNFNPKLSNMVGEVLNGRCVVDPLDFGEPKEVEE